LLNDLTTTQVHLNGLSCGMQELRRTLFVSIRSLSCVMLSLNFSDQSLYGFSVPQRGVLQPVRFLVVNMHRKGLRLKISLYLRLDDSDVHVLHSHGNRRTDRMVNASQIFINFDHLRRSGSFAGRNSAMASHKLYQVSWLLVSTTRTRRVTLINGSG
jgi:hypothetical protein